ncbi:MAG: glycine dehydrogenase (aminomethyl-transferring), partial [Sphingobacteriales bacterium]|nr:glycine dehydrogenase (aminomethyl-transferring) [Sphingobacteriales bacterium]
MNLFEQQQAEFIGRHIGPNAIEIAEMLKQIKMQSVDELIEKTIPASIRLKQPLQTGNSMSEYEYLTTLKTIAQKNKIYKSYIGNGYYNTIMPSVILRNVFENPGWYTQYTPYQAEIAQGRLESLLNYQTMISDLTGLPIANASLLDEGTAAAEGMAMLFNHKNKHTDNIVSPNFFVDENISEQTKEVLKTRSKPINVELVFGDYKTIELDQSYFGAIVQYPNKNGQIDDYRSFIEKAHSQDAQVIMATDLLALCLLTPPGELGADIAIGNSQRFGVPMGFGGPHAAFFATKDAFKRNVPGRIIGVSVDANGNRCLRMALQTREQHIRREKATSNICTAQALLANIAAFYAVYHGASGLKNISKRTSLLANMLSNSLSKLGFKNENTHYFDTLQINVDQVEKLKDIAERKGINFGYHANKVNISLDETTSLNDVQDIIAVFSTLTNKSIDIEKTNEIELLTNIPSELTRTSEFLTHPVFNTYRSETQMMRYLKSLENKDLSL